MAKYIELTGIFDTKILISADAIQAVEDCYAQEDLTDQIVKGVQYSRVLIASESFLVKETYEEIKHILISLHES